MLTSGVTSDFLSASGNEPSLRLLCTNLVMDLDLFVVLRRVQQPGSYCDG